MEDVRQGQRRGDRAGPVRRQEERDGRLRHAEVRADDHHRLHQYVGDDSGDCHIERHDWPQRRGPEEQLDADPRASAEGLLVVIGGDAQAVRDRCRQHEQRRGGEADRRTEEERVSPDHQQQRRGEHRRDDRLEVLGQACQ